MSAILTIPRRDFIDKVDGFWGDIDWQIRPKASDFEVVLAIITEKRGRWSDMLPFHAKQSLFSLTRRLEELSVRFSIEKIRVIEEDPATPQETREIAEQTGALPDSAKSGDQPQRSTSKQ
ncbi:MAG: DUF6119 family protein [Oligoflexus sp.]